MFKFTRSTLYLSMAALLSQPTLAQNSGYELPDIGTAAASTLTIDQESLYGDAYMRMLRRSQPIVNDPVLNEYISTIGHQLVANANDVKTPFNFFLIQDRDINAFAFFGGYVALHSGLFLHAQTESELASVLAHEIAHITQRHLARAMEDQARRSPATIAALVGSLLLAVAAPQAGIAAIAATQAGMIQSQINYTRSNEKEADRFGIVTMSKAGFDPQAMPQFFGRLADEFRYVSKPPPMLLTHPLPEDRITDSRARAQSMPPKRLGPSIEYNLARARIIARHAGIDSEAAIDWMDRRLKKAHRDIVPTLKYGKALALLDMKKLDEAETLLVQLDKQDPNNNFYLDALSDLYLYKKEYDKGLAMLKRALDKKPNNPVLEINYANLLVESERYNEATRLLQRYTHSHPEDVNGWAMLADSTAQQGKRDEEAAARGEIFALKADWKQAISFYAEASKLVELGSLKQARYDARIDQLGLQRDRFYALQN
ncbi:beta-barrel assembly-enhancing protease [Vibrio penaeicida]|uniref:Putative beta-barrel assembly-enhancing protease n=1 Tax=Vibrio penaeicida TaxID=104609 RepID=A0AAV5NX11_9VIBR|nr:M48 family metallopeptidase [Vibrio penaeicida]RTZ21446.1 M48 family peptidase [Vibrio penaeicida]GLQ75176.1 putative beta-barrel assembly-enhancing protease [Vibrio penaeicida]